MGACFQTSLRVFRVRQVEKIVKFEPKLSGHGLLDLHDLIWWCKERTAKRLEVTSNKEYTIENVLYNVTFSLLAGSCLHHHVRPYKSSRPWSEIAEISKSPPQVTKFWLKFDQFLNLTHLEYPSKLVQNYAVCLFQVCKAIRAIGDGQESFQ